MKNGWVECRRKKKGEVALEPCHPQKKERDSFFFLTFALKFVRADVQKKIVYVDSRKKPTILLMVCMSLFVCTGKKVSLSLDHRVDGGLEDALAVQKLELDQENELEDMAAQLLDQLLGTSSTATSGDQVINDDHVLASLDGILLHLEDVLLYGRRVTSGSIGSNGWLISAQETLSS